MEKNTYHLISLGCAKNTVDSQRVADILNKVGMKFQFQRNDAEFLIVNTCGFIQAARDEALQILDDLGSRKQPGQYLLAIGCMAENNSQLIAERCPHVDGILGTRSITDILKLIRQVSANRTLPDVNYGDLPESQTAAEGASAYLKIADGCNRYCGFCSIPLIKGNWRSRPEEAILADARRLANSGIKEINLIAQDTTAYGLDLGMKDALPDLLLKLSHEVQEVPWIRLLYAFPGYVSEHLIDVIASTPNIVKYLDIPLQHGHPEMLRRMRRPDDLDWVHNTIAKMRSRIEGLAIRSTFIVGYPNETEEEFQALADFMEEMRFDRVGVFKYSFEPGTYSASFGDTVPEKVKEKRLDRLMTLQQRISKQLNRRFVSKTLDVLIEGRQKGLLVGRSYRDAPDVDCVVFAEGDAPSGSIVPVKIHTAMEYDLVGKIAI